MKIIKIILGIQLCVLGVLAIIWMLGELAFIGMELDMMSKDYDMHMQMWEEVDNDKMD